MSKPGQKCISDSTTNKIGQRMSKNDLTQQLTETAFGVRLARRQIGQAVLKLEKPNTVMIVSKVQDETLIALTRHLAFWLITEPKPKSTEGFDVYVDGKLEKHPVISPLVGMLGKNSAKLHFWTPEFCAATPEAIDFVLTLGGDGTVLYTSWLFQKAQVPPIIPFHLGSMGFLTTFSFKEIKQVLQRVVGCDADSGVRITLRMRFSCTVWRRQSLGEQRGSLSGVLSSPDVRKAVAKSGANAMLPSSLSPSAYSSRNNASGTSHEVHFSKPIPMETFMILNDLVVDRGPSPYISQLELYGDDKHLTTVQADGLVIATPTGSTAYSLSAGGNMVHPEVPAILVTPICAHTLSFRPMLLPDSMELKVCVPHDSRNTAFCSFDGRHRIELRQGDFVTVTMGLYPCPTVCSTDPSDDWFKSLSRCLQWNERVKQKPWEASGEGEKLIEEMVGSLCDACPSTP